jgi:hypothetical protein
MTDEQLIERLAALSHEQWAGWADWMLENLGAIHPHGETYIRRWQRQIDTPYDLLSEAEKESDRIEARKMLAAIRAVEPTGPSVTDPDRSPQNREAGGW